MSTIDDPRIGYGGGGRISVILGPRAAAMCRVMGARLRVDVPEVVRLAIGLYHLWMSLPEGKYLAVVDEKTGNVDRVIPEKAVER